MKNCLSYFCRAVQLLGVFSAVTLVVITVLTPSFSRTVVASEVTRSSPSGFCFIAPLGITTDFPYLVLSDKEAHNASVLEFFEDGRKITSSHAVHAEIDSAGEGRYSHWGGDLFFSASDNSDPRSNGHVYTAEVTASVEGWVYYSLVSSVVAALVCFLWYPFWRTVRACRPVAKTIFALYPAAIFVWSIFPPSATFEVPTESIQSYGGHGYVWQTPTSGWFTRLRADQNQSPKASRGVMHEDGRPLMPPHADHYLIARNGAGRFSHWQETVVFSALDNTDPRTNGKRYTFITPQFPSLGLVGSAMLLFLVQIYFWSTRVAIFQRVVGVGCVMVLMVAVFASLTRCIPIRGDFQIERSAIAPMADNKKFPEYRNFRGSIYDFRGPFFEMNLDSAPFRKSVELLVGDEQPRRAQLGKEDDVPFTDPASQFTLGFGEFKFGVKGGDRDLTALPVVFRAPMAVTVGGVWLLWLMVVSLAVWYLRIPHIKASPRFLLPQLAVETVGSLGFLLLVASGIGEVLPFGQEDLSTLQKKSNFGEQDRTLNWEQTKEELARLRTLTDEDEVILKAGNLVSERIVHNWFYVNVEELRLQVPITENWILWLRGELLPNYRQYNFADYMLTLERGVGNCGQASMALVGFLSSLGIQCKIWGFDGHTVVWAKSKSGREYILDSDYGVFWQGSFADFIKEPGLTDRYTVAFDRMGTKSDKRVIEINRVTTVFNSGAPKPSTLEEFHGTESSRVERFAYTWKWWGPTGSLLPYLFWSIVRRRVRI